MPKKRDLYETQRLIEEKVNIEDFRVRYVKLRSVLIYENLYLEFKSATKPILHALMKEAGLEPYMYLFEGAKNADKNKREGYFVPKTRQKIKRNIVTISMNSTTEQLHDKLVKEVIVFGAYMGLEATKSVKMMLNYNDTRAKGIFKTSKKIENILADAEIIERLENKDGVFYMGEEYRALEKFVLFMDRFSRGLSIVPFSEAILRAED